MNRYNLFLVLIAILLIALFGSAGCNLAAVSQTNTPTGTGDNNNNSTVPTEVVTTQDPVSAATTTPDDNTISSDPVSGQSEEVDFRWEQLCLSSEYQVQIAKDPGFTIIVLDTGSFAPASSESPAAYYPAGGRATSPSSLSTLASLEAGHTYYWRARTRQAATGQYMLSPWSEVQSFTVKSGTPTTNVFYGIQPTYPNNGCIINPLKPVSFSWSPLNDVAKYKFVLAEDAAMTQVIKEAEVTTTAYYHDGQLEYSKVYFWRVMALEPVPGDWSATFSFQTEAPPASPPATPNTPQTPFWAWVVIVVGLILLIVIIVLIFRMRRR